MNSPYRLYSSLPAPAFERNAAHISIPALLNNYRLLLAAARDTTPDVRPICVVKADAYGHGADVVAHALAGDGCDFFAVSCIEEAQALRVSLGDKPDILILGYTDPRAAALLAEYDIIQTVLSREYMLRLSDEAAVAGVSVRVHLKLDTGMNRIGLPAQSESQIEQTAAVAVALARTPGLIFEGMFTHFSRADEDIAGESGSPEASASPDDALADTLVRRTGEDFTALQFARYRAVEKIIEANGITIPCRHVCNSAASVRHPEYRLDCVRFGIMLYGLLPSGDVDFPGLLPVMKLTSVISHIHTLTPGAAAGYGGCFTSNIPRKIATVPIGYADGFIRAYSGGTVKIVHGGKEYSATISGRICMDQLTLDASGIDCAPGDSVILFGSETGDLEVLARRAGTIGYESLCIISSRIPRHYLYGGLK